MPILRQKQYTPIDWSMIFKPMLEERASQRMLQRQQDLQKSGDVLNTQREDAARSKEYLTKALSNPELTQHLNAAGAFKDSGIDPSIVSASIPSDTEATQSAIGSIGSAKTEQDIPSPQDAFSKAGGDLGSMAMRPSYLPSMPDEQTGQPTLPSSQLKYAVPMDLEQVKQAANQRQQALRGIDNYKLGQQPVMLPSVGPTGQKGNLPTTQAQAQAQGFTPSEPTAEQAAQQDVTKLNLTAQPLASAAGLREKAILQQQLAPWAIKARVDEAAQKQKQLLAGDLQKEGNLLKMKDVMAMSQQLGGLLPMAFESDKLVEEVLKGQGTGPGRAITGMGASSGLNPKAKRLSEIANGAGLMTVQILGNKGQVSEPDKAAGMTYWPTASDSYETAQMKQVARADLFEVAPKVIADLPFDVTPQQRFDYARKLMLERHPEHQEYYKVLPPSVGPQPGGVTAPAAIPGVTNPRLN